MTANNDYLTNEQKLIENIKQWTGSRYIGDDCAILPGGQLVTEDSLVEGTHFITRLIGLKNLGWKAAAVNLSDIAAMAGRPRHLVVGLTMPAGFGTAQTRDLMVSLTECARRYRTDVVGGDLTRGPSLMIGVTVIGETHERGCLTRAGAIPGDVIVVSGDFGASAAGLWSLLNQSKSAQLNSQYVLSRHLRPLPRLCESWSLVRQTGSRGALMDASDGLADALVQIGRASQVGMEIDAQAIPVHAETQSLASLAQVNALDWALYGGEDYELVGCLAADVWQRWQKSGLDNPFKAIGVVKAQKGIWLNNRGQKSELNLKKTFQHW